MTTFALALLALAVAQETKPEPKKDDGDKPVTVTHAIDLPAGELKYESTVGRMPLRDDDGKPRAHMSYFAYRKLPADAKRPVLFAFNGGPGSSSVWLHMGAFGPQRVAFDNDGKPLPPPFKLVPNDLNLLDVADLVFIDPVGTGYSRPADPKEGNKFYGVQEDISSVGDFIAQYATRENRWASPKFLAGESYGTTRAAGLAGYLQNTHGMNLNGVILISAILNFQGGRFDEGNDLPFVTFLPTYTATAWYHKKIPGDLRKLLDESEAFAKGEYATALLKGADLTTEETEAVATKLAKLTGLSLDYVRRSNLRVISNRFTKELLRDQRITVGRFDSRLKGADLDAVGESYEYDPSYAAIQGPYTAAFRSYVRQNLDYETDLNYDILTGKVQPWNYGDARNRYLNVAPTLRSAMTQNRSLKVYLASGYYDLATPYFAADHTFAHLGLPPELRKNVKVGYYEGGHMMYTIRKEHEKLRKELGAFLESAVAP